MAFPVDHTATCSGCGHLARIDYPHRVCVDCQMDRAWEGWRGHECRRAFFVGPRPWWKGASSWIVNASPEQAEPESGEQRPAITDEEDEDRDSEVGDYDVDLQELRVAADQGVYERDARLWEPIALLGVFLVDLAEGYGYQPGLARGTTVGTLHPRTPSGPDVDWRQQGQGRYTPWPAPLLPRARS